MEWFKKIVGFLTNPKLSVIRILSAVATAMFILLCLHHIGLLIMEARHFAAFKKCLVVSDCLPPTFRVNESKKIGNLVTVDVTVRNPPHNQGIYISAGEFALKDERLMMCDRTTDANLLEKEKKPALTNSRLQAGEEVRGVIMFVCSDPALKEFTLMYEDVLEKLSPLSVKPSSDSYAAKEVR